jgi:hypothetical protein
VFPPVAAIVEVAIADVPPVWLVMPDVPPVAWSPPVAAVVAVVVWPPVACGEVVDVVELPPVPGVMLDEPPVTLVWKSPPVVLGVSMESPPPVLGSSAPGMNSSLLPQAVALSEITIA